MVKMRSSRLLICGLLLICTTPVSFSRTLSNSAKQNNINDDPEENEREFKAGGIDEDGESDFSIEGILTRAINLVNRRPIPNPPEVPSQDGDAADEPVVDRRADDGQDEPETKLRPVLQTNTFGYRHAQHLNPKYSYHQISSPFGARQKQTFPTHRQSNVAQCSIPDFRCELHQKYRKADGSCNNLKRPILGKSETPYRRLLPRKHSLVACGGAALSRLPNARLASRLLTKRSEVDVNNHLSIYVMVWGQLIDHDIMMTPVRQTAGGEFLDCCAQENEDAEDCCPIKIPRGDFFYDQVERPDCIPFLRSKLTPFPGTCKDRMLPDVENMNTGWIDMSYLYGSSVEREQLLRAETGGKLLASEDRAKRMFPHIDVNDGFRMEFGDTRGDVHPAFTLLNTVFLRFHNILTDQLAQLHPGWSSDKLYLEAKKINSAIGQHITYTQFMDALLGTPNSVRTNDRRMHHNYYRPSLDPRISMIFSTAAYRLHTFVSGKFDLRDQSYRLTSSMRLRDVFHDPLKLLANNTYDDLIRGLTAQSLQEFNNIYSPEMTEWLFAEKEEDFGLDIVSLNVQRGRDHQIQGYTRYREFCGLGDVHNWDDLEDFILHEDVHRLAHTYRKPDDVDMYIGASMEIPVKGSMVGPTMHCYIREQFEVLRDGDRFFYTNPGQFTKGQLAAIKQTSLSSMLCETADNPEVMRLPKNAFMKINSRTNKIFPCSDFPKFAVDRW